MAARWLQRLSPYDYTIHHRAGKLHDNADGLSRQRRRPCKRPGGSDCKLINLEGQLIAVLPKSIEEEDDDVGLKCIFEPTRLVSRVTAVTQNTNAIELDSTATELESNSDQPILSKGECPVDVTPQLITAIRATTRGRPKKASKDVTSKPDASPEGQSQSPTQSDAVLVDPLAVHCSDDLREAQKQDKDITTMMTLLKISDTTLESQARPVLIDSLSDPHRS